MTLVPCPGSGMSVDVDAGTLVDCPCCNVPTRTIADNGDTCLLAHDRDDSTFDRLADFFDEVGLGPSRSLTVFRCQACRLWVAGDAPRVELEAKHHDVCASPDCQPLPEELERLLLDALSALGSFASQVGTVTDPMWLRRFADLLDDVCATSMSRLAELEAMAS